MHTFISLLNFPISQQIKKCKDRCERLDVQGNCRINFLCKYSLDPHTSNRIIDGGSCPRCYRKDYKGRCRLSLRCFFKKKKKS